MILPPQTTITTASILEMVKQGWNAIIELYKQSTPEQREKILKILASLGGFAALLKYLKSALKSKETHIRITGTLAETIKSKIQKTTKTQEIG